ncbi:MAG: chalcone isomerase family protein [Mariprofundaceae bacterium]
MKHGFMMGLGMLLLVSLSAPADAVEVEGVSIPDVANVGGQNIALNGAGVRTKFFFDIYVGALYLQERATSAKQAVAANGPKRITMSFLYDEVSSEKLVDGWIEGFEKNQSKALMEALKDRLDQFNVMFITAHRGDLFVFDFLENGNTVVTLKGEKAGEITGADFQRALLEVWLGKKPADKGLKKAMIQG